MFNYDCVVPTQIHKSINYILYGCGLAFCRPHAVRQSRVRVSTPRLNGHGLEKLEMDTRKCDECLYAIWDEFTKLEKANK